MEENFWIKVKMLFQALFSPIIDLYIFYRVSGWKLRIRDYVFSVIFIGICVLLGDLTQIDDFLVDVIQAISVFLFSYFVRKEKKVKLIIGLISFFELLDILITISVEILLLIFDINFSSIIFIFLLIDFLVVCIIQKYYLKIRKLLNDRNSSIFIGLILYIYLSSSIVYLLALQNNRMTTLFEVSLSLLILQIIFSIFAYSTAINIQKKLLTEQEQKEQKLQLELANADRKAKEAENRELVLKQQKLKSEMRQLQEYSSYLDKNEDDLRRFKHDYQNILNGLKVSAQEGDTTKVVKILDLYTNTQFDQKALRKYKGVNHIHEKNLKSIAIAKLSKLYSLDLNYSFDCEQNISQIPKSVNILDLVRIIGIAFDNAAEESMALIKETGSTNNARVDAMYYQENGDFEFEIRNRVREATIATDKMSQKNFTTKKHHMGLGLANVKEITHKYEDVMIVNYYVDDGWFTFDLTILPDDENEIED